MASWENACEGKVPIHLQNCIEEALYAGKRNKYLAAIEGSLISFDVVPIKQGNYANLYGHDVTELKRAEEELCRRNEEWERTFDSVPDLIAIMDDNHHVVRINSAMAARLGVSRESCIGKPCFISVHGTDRPPGFCPHLLTMTDGMEHAAELHDKNLGGDFLVTTTPILDDKGKRIGSVHVARDITERKRAEDALQSAKEAAEAANLAKGLFLANMSHELRTPLTGLLGMLDVARTGPLDDRQREAVNLAHMSGQALLSIINDILDLSRIENSKLVIIEKPFSLKECMAVSVEMLMPGARNKGLALEWSISGDLPDNFIGDRLRIQQVLTNLIGNAVKFTDSGKVEVIVTSSKASHKGIRDVNFSVKDTGIGIPEDKREIIFQTFCQADESYSRRFGGAGLGLAISRELVGLMGGNISCRSKEGEGSIFTFSIPLAETSLDEARPGDTTPPEIATVPHQADQANRRVRLLVAEDDEVTRKVLGFMLKQSGFHLEFAADGIEVVEKWENGSYDLIVMDGQMPGMDGFAATRAIRERERVKGGHIPIVAMTAHALREDRERCLAAGMDDYVSKPIDFNKCLKVINGLVDPLPAGSAEGDRDGGCLAEA
jgi:PAS domain S-box-containing protein